MKSVYLAGPIQHDKGHGVSWRDEIKRDFSDFEWNDPLDKYNPEDPDVTFYYNHDEKSDLYELKTQFTESGDSKYVTVDDIVEGDKRMIDRSDAILVGWSEVPSCGTPMEVMYQFMVNNLHPHREHVPIVVWWRDAEPQSHLSPWMEHHTDYVTQDREDAIEWLELEFDYVKTESVRREDEPCDLLRGSESNMWSSKQVQKFMENLERREIRDSNQTRHRVR